jgi:N-acyl-D-amino-acid deacylase
MRRFAVLSVTVGWVVAACLAAELPSVETGYDLVIRNGRIVDGGGNPWYVADVGVRDGRIAEIGRLCGAEGCPAGRVIDAAGLIVAPGFIDVHTHSEDGIRRAPSADNYLFDGVTSVITGNCGGSASNLAAFFAELRLTSISVNLGSLIGHNTVRREVMGTDLREPTSEELARMEQLVEEAMREGAVGLSTGLIYAPGSFAKTPEIAALARVAARFDGVYATHLRNEGNDEQGGVFDAIDEALEVGRLAGVPVQISHFKVAGKRVWGLSAKTLAKVENARQAGLDVTLDQYPYTASSTSLGVLLPARLYEGGREQLLKQLADPPTRKRICQEVLKRIRRRGFKKLDYAVVARCSWDSSLEGKSIAQINRERKRKRRLEAEVETALEMIEKGGATMVYHTMHEEDVERILRYPYAMVASDGGIVEFGKGVPHPRSYGTNARVLGRYARERKVVRLEEAVRKMTSLPAQRFRLLDRGLVRPGMWADLVVFDDQTVADLATFEKPHAPSGGFRYVLVNGVVVVHEGRHTGARPGRILLGPGSQERRLRSGN